VREEEEGRADLGELQILEEVGDRSRRHDEQASAGSGRDLAQENEQSLQHLIRKSEMREW
jgi:hypothetical protein